MFSYMGRKRKHVDFTPYFRFYSFKGLEILLICGVLKLCSLLLALKLPKLEIQQFFLQNSSNCSLMLNISLNCFVHPVGYILYIFRCRTNKSMFVSPLFRCLWFYLYQLLPSNLVSFWLHFQMLSQRYDNFLVLCFHLCDRSRSPTSTISACYLPIALNTKLGSR